MRLSTLLVRFAQFPLFPYQWLVFLQFKYREIFEIVWKLELFTNIVDVYASITILHACIINATIAATFISRMSSEIVVEKLTSSYS